MLDTVYDPTPASAAFAPDPITERVRATWTAGNFGRIAKGYASGAAEFIARLQLAPDERVLDVACGTGNLALPAARAGALVTGIDIAPNLIRQAAASAAGERLTARFEVGDAEQLPYADASFDTTVSMFGAMFAARPERAAAELLRVTRPGGRIAMANWTPTGFVGQMLRIVVGYVPPPPGSVSVLQWGDEAIVGERLAGAERIDCVRRRIAFEYPFSAAGATLQDVVRADRPCVRRTRRRAARAARARAGFALDRLQPRPGRNDAGGVGIPRGDRRPLTAGEWCRRCRASLPLMGGHLHPIISDARSVHRSEDERIVEIEGHRRPGAARSIGVEVRHHTP
jgi:SAM-dependent methyltransferase